MQSMRKPIEIPYDHFVDKKIKIAKILDTSKSDSLDSMFDSMFRLIDIDRNAKMYECLEQLADMFCDIDVDIQEEEI